MTACGSDSGSSSESTAAGAATTVAGETTVAGATTTAAATGGASGEMEVYSWWTSGSEQAALKTLFSTVTAANPGLTIVDAAVAGGAGTNAKQVLATRLSSGDIPATWQTHAGGALADYVSQDVTTDLSALYDEQGWAAVLPASLLESMTVDGAVQAVATGVHRGNNLFYNKAVLDKAGVTFGESTSFADLTAAADKIKATGVAPLCLGDKDVWTDVTLLENLIIAELGADAYMELLSGKRSWADAGVATAVANFQTMLTWAQEDHQALDWTGAVDALAEGKCAFNSMGDWEYGELLVKQQLVDGTDFGATILGDSNVFSTVTDVFVVGKGSSNEAGAVEWMKALMDPVAQIEFAKLKGSSPARNDVDVTQLGPIGQRNAKALATGTLVPSLAQDQANIAPSVSQAFSEAVTLLVADANGESFAAAMDAAIASA